MDCFLFLGLQARQTKTKPTNEFIQGIPLEMAFIYCTNLMIWLQWHDFSGMSADKWTAPNKMHTPVDRRDPTNQLRLVAYHIIFSVFCTLSGGYIAGFQPSTVDLEDHWDTHGRPCTTEWGKHQLPGSCWWPILWDGYNILPGKLTNVPWKINGWKMYFLLKYSLFRGHLNFQGCKCPLSRVGKMKNNRQIKMVVSLNHLSPVPSDHVWLGWSSISRCRDEPPQRNSICVLVQFGRFTKSDVIGGNVGGNGCVYGTTCPFIIVIFINFLLLVGQIHPTSRIICIYTHVYEYTFIYIYIHTSLHKYIYIYICIPLEISSTKWVGTCPA